MKKLLALLLLAGGLSASAQTLPLPIDSTSGKITFQGVVAVPGASQLELYSRAREWFAATFGSSKTVLEMDDRESGKLIGRAYAQFEFAGVFGEPLPWTMWRTIKVEVKEGRYRYTISDFILGTSVTYPNISPPTKPIESWLADFQKSKKPLGKMAARQQDSVIKGIRSTGEQEVQSLRGSMTKQAGKSDW